MTYCLMALRMCSTFRNISGEAECVIAGIVPKDILANKAPCLYEKTRMHLPEKDTGYGKTTRRKSLKK